MFKILIASNEWQSIFLQIELAENPSVISSNWWLVCDNSRGNLKKNWQFTGGFDFYAFKKWILAALGANKHLYFGWNWDAGLK